MENLTKNLIGRCIYTCKINRMMFDQKTKGKYYEYNVYVRKWFIITVVLLCSWLIFKTGWKDFKAEIKDLWNDRKLCGGEIYIEKIPSQWQMIKEMK